MLNEYIEVQLRQYNSSDVPLVSISCITYNHCKYIKDAIEGFLMQRTNFPIEILIHDDASTDGTTDIIREYEQKYPDIIKPIYEKENQWNKGRRGSLVFNVPRAKGKYIAFCEGDDYWTDPYKLQKQVDFLEENPEYGMVHTDANYYYTENGLLINNYHKYKNINCFSGNVYDLLIKSEYPIITCTVVIRTEYYKELLNNPNHFLMADTLIWLEIAYRTKIKYLDESTAVRNMLKESASNSKDINKILNFKISGYELYKYIVNKYGCSSKTEEIMHQKCVKGIFILALKAGNFDIIKSYQPLILKYHIKFSIKELLSIIYNIFKNLLYGKYK